MVEYSPFEPVLAKTQLPEVIRKQFLYDFRKGEKIIVKGTMQKIWYRPKILGFLFRFMERNGILIAANEKNIPTVFETKVGRTKSNILYFVWKRTYKLNPPKVFSTIVYYDPKLNRVVDIVTNKRRLFMSWETEVIDGMLKLDTYGYAIRIKSRLFYLPKSIWKWFLGFEKFRQKVDSKDPNKFHIDLRVSHPLFGNMIGYKGSFKIYNY